MKVLRILLDHWYWPAVVVLVLLVSGAYLFTGRRKSAANWLAIIPSELAALTVKREAREVEIDHGFARALYYVYSRYDADIKAIEAESGSIMESLPNDPQKLAMALERVSRHHRRHR